MKIKNIIKLRKLNKKERNNLFLIERLIAHTRAHYSQIEELKDKKDYSSHITINDRKCWKSIPTSDYSYIYRVHKTIPNNSYFSSFLDVGAGFGNVMLAASAIGYKASGLEYQKRIINYKLTKNDIFEIDAFNFLKYDDYDVIYLYMPIADCREMGKLLTIITNQISKGKIVIFLPAGIVRIPKKLRRIENTNHVYQKE